MLAEIARMIAIECFRDGLGQRLGLRIFHEHRGPRDRLKRDPVSAHRKTQGDDDERARGDSNHAFNMGTPARRVNGDCSVLVGRDAVEPSDALVTAHTTALWSWRTRRNQVSDLLHFAAFGAPKLWL